MRDPGEPPLDAEAARGLRASLGALKAAASASIGDLRIRAARNTRRRPVRPGPVTVAGFFDDPRGVARGAQLAADALERLGLPVVRHDISPLLRAKTPALPPGEGGALVVHANPPELRTLLRRWPAAAWRDRYCVGYWVWELERAPASWRAAADWVDEIWAPSRFAADAFAEWGVPTRVMPHPVPPAAGRRDRGRFALPEDRPVALTAFDGRSTLARKNPDGAVAAFLRAVEERALDALLVVKALAPFADQPGWDALRRRLHARADIRVIDQPLEEKDMATLLASVDLLVSLHRSEGFGLLLAEAMRAGTPVVATAWSAPLEYIPASAAALTPCRLAPVHDPSGRYAVAGARWAEPDIEAAAAQIGVLLAEPRARAEIGEAGRRAIAGAQAMAYTHESLSADFLASALDVGGASCEGSYEPATPPHPAGAEAPLGRKPPAARRSVYVAPRRRMRRPESAEPGLTSPVAHFEGYAARLCALVGRIDWSVLAPLALELADCVKSRRHVFLCGNGGSAANACHLSNDLIYGSAKRPGFGLRASALAANPSVLTCLANDEGYESIFELQLRELADRGDVLIACSGSGESPNIVRALVAARELGLRSYALLGYSGGACKALADHPIHFPIDDMQIAEDMQLVVGHMLTQWLWANRSALGGARDAA